jgi:hypothetical protein
MTERATRVLVAWLVSELFSSVTFYTTRAMAVHRKINVHYSVFKIMHYTLRYKYDRLCSLRLNNDKGTTHLIIPSRLTNKCHWACISLSSMKHIIYETKDEYTSKHYNTPIEGICVEGCLCCRWPWYPKHDKERVYECDSINPSAMNAQVPLAWREMPSLVDYTLIEDTANTDTVSGH